MSKSNVLKCLILDQAFCVTFNKIAITIHVLKDYIPYDENISLRW